MKIARVGNKKAHGRACYATGGRVGEDISDPGSLPIMSDEPDGDEGMGVDGGKSKPRLDRARKSGTTVNIVVGASKPEAPPTPAIPAMGAPPMPPPGPVPPPGVPMRASGGRVCGGAGGGLGRLEKAKAYGDKPAKGK